MKALFAHELKFYETEDGKLYLRGYEKKFWNRYLNHFNEMYIIGRKVCLNNVDINDYNEFNGDGIFFIEVPDINNPIKYLNNIRRTKQTIANLVQSVDCVITRLPGIYPSTALEYSKKYNKPYIVEMVGCPWDAYWNHSIKGKIIAPFMTFTTKKLVKHAPYCVYVTNEFLQRRYPCDGQTIGCSDVALPSLDDSVLKRRLDKITHMNLNEPIILGTAGAIDVKYKGQVYVIKAISILNKQGYNFEYHLAGDGDNKFLESVAEYNNVADKVVFLGVLPHEDIYEYLDSIDIYIQPSRAEGLPRALIEAMSRACPSLGSATGGIPELLSEDMMFCNGVVEDIVSLLKKMNKQKMVLAANRCFQKAKEFDSSVLDKNRMEFYGNFINANK